jgi:hypothetical protein
VRVEEEEGIKMEHKARIFIKEYIHPNMCLLSSLFSNEKFFSIP